MCPKETHKLTSLHTILSTGSPLKPQSYDYVYSHIKRDVLLGSITGKCVYVCMCGCSSGVWLSCPMGPEFEAHY